MKKGQAVKITRSIWGHKPGTKGKVTKVLDPDDSQTRINNYVGQVKLRGSPKMYVQPGDVEECAQHVVATMLNEEFPPLGAKQQLGARARDRERKRQRGTPPKGIYFSGAGYTGAGMHPIGGGGTGPGMGA